MFTSNLLLYNCGIRSIKKIKDEAVNSVINLTWLSLRKGGEGHDQQRETSRQKGELNAQWFSLRKRRRKYYFQQEGKKH